MDLLLIGSVVMLVVWAILTFTTEAPGYVHLLLTLGVFILIWRITVRVVARHPPATAGITGGLGERDRRFGEWILQRLSR
jgi:hypothetical protein